MLIWKQIWRTQIRRHIQMDKFYQKAAAYVHCICQDNWVNRVVWNWISIFYFFLKTFGGHESFLWGHWYPCFGLLVMSPLGFKARVGSALFELSRGVCVTLHVPWDSPLVWHLPTSWQPAWQPSHLFHIPARHWWDSKPGAIMPPLTVWDQADALPTELSRRGSGYQFYSLHHINTQIPFPDY